MTSWSILVIWVPIIIYIMRTSRSVEVCMAIICLLPPSFLLDHNSSHLFLSGLSCASVSCWIVVGSWMWSIKGFSSRSVLLAWVLKFAWSCWVVLIEWSVLWDQSGEISCWSFLPVDNFESLESEDLCLSWAFVIVISWLYVRSSLSYLVDIFEQ